MARKDVSLNIRATDNASSAVSKIGASLDDFRRITDDLEGSGDRTGKTLSAIASAAEKANRALGGLKAPEFFGDQFQDAAEALNNLQGEARATEDDMASLDAEIRRASEAAEELARATERARAAQDEQRAEVTAAKKEVKSAQAAAEAAAQADAARAARLKALPGLIEKESAALREATRRYEELTQAKYEAMARRAPTGTATGLPTDLVPASTLTRLDASSRNVAAIEARLASLRGEFEQVGSSSSAAGAAMAFFGRDVETAQARLGAAEASLAQTGANLADLKTRATQTKTELTGLERALEDTGTRAKTLGAQIERAEANLDGIGESGRQAAAELAKIEGVAVDGLVGALIEQRHEVERTRAELAELEAQTDRVNRAVSVLTGPTEAQARELKELAQAAEEAGDRLLVQEDALDRMGAVNRSATRDLAGLATALRSIQGIRVEADADLERISREGAGAREALRRVDAEAAKVGSSSGRAAQGMRSLGTAAGAARPKLRDLAGDLDRLDDSQRAMGGLSLAGLRGEVAGLIAAYAGLDGTIELIRRVVDAFTTLESVQARLTVANDSSIALTGEDMAFVREQADRLGISLGVLADEYSKIRIASQNTNLEGQRARDIFLSVAEAGRVLRLSQDDMQGIFRAVNQMISKGKVQAEELTQQLGDRLPGALQIMADGLGVTTGELFKMMEQGQVTSDALVGFAEQLDARFASGLDAALSSASAEMGRLGNAAFLAMEGFADAGFIDAFINLIRELGSMLKGSDFSSFAERMSAGIAVLIDGLAIMADNFQIVMTVIGGALGIVALKLLTRLRAAVVANIPPTLGLAAGWRSWRAAMMLASTGADRAIITLYSLRAALIGVAAAWAPLLALTAGAAFFAWMSGATEANTQLERHAQLMERINEIRANAGTDSDIQKLLQSGFTADALQLNLESMVEQAQAARDGVSEALRGSVDEDEFGGIDVRDAAEFEAESQIEDLIDLWDQAGVSVDEVRQRIGQIGAEFREATGQSLPLSEDIYARLAESYEAERKVLEAREAAYLEAGQFDLAAAVRGDMAALDAANGQLTPTRTGDAEEIAKARAKVDEYVASLDAQIRQQTLVNAGMEEQAQIEEALARARDANENVGFGRGGRDMLAGIVQRVQALRALEEAEKREGANRKTDERLAAMRAELREQELLNDGKERQVAVERAIADAIKENPGLADEGNPQRFARLKEIREAAEALFTMARAQEALNAAQDAYQSNEQLIADLDRQIALARIRAEGEDGERRAAFMEDFFAAVGQGALPNQAFAQALRSQELRDLADASEEAKTAAEEQARAEEERAERLRATRDAIEDLRFEQDQLRTRAKGDERAAFVAETMRAAQDANPDLQPGTKLYAEYEAEAGALYDLEQATDALTEARERAATVRESLDDAREEARLNLLRAQGLDALADRQQRINALRDQGGTDADVAELERVIDLEEKYARLLERREGDEATASFLSDLSDQVQDQRDLNAGLNREVAIRRAIRAARGSDKFLSDAEIRQITDLAGAQFDLEEAAKEAAEEEKRLREEAERLERQAEATAERLEDMAEATEGFRDAVRDVLRDTDLFGESIERLEEREAFGDLVEEAQDAAVEILELHGVFENFDSLARTFDSKHPFLSFLTELETVVPDAIGLIDGLAGSVLSLGQGLSDATGGIGGFFAGLIEGATTASAEEMAAIFGDASTGAAMARALIIERESTSSDPNAGPLRPKMDTDGLLRIGYMSDTITRSDGTVQRGIGPNDRISMEDAERDLMRRIGQAFDIITGTLKRQAGMDDAGAAARFESLGPEVQAALASIVYNYGELPGRIVEAVATGSNDQIANAILSLQNDNDGINAGRRQQEAAIVRGAEDINVGDALAEAETERREEAQERAEELQDQRDATQDRLADQEFEIAQQERMNAGLERQAAVEEAIREAREENPQISEEQLALVAENAGRTWDLANANWENERALEAAQKAQEEINNLTATRGALEEQLQAALEDGDATRAEELAGQIEGVNAELLTAIANARTLWEAVGGTEGQAAVAQLDAAEQATRDFSTAADAAYLKWESLGDLFVRGLASAIDRIAEGWEDADNKMELVRDSFLQFAGEFLLEIARMIVQQAIFNGLQAMFGGTRFGSLIGIPAQVAHTGGTAGVASRTRTVNPTVFAGALRYHEGGVVGLKPGEVPIIAEEGERILTEEQDAMLARQQKGGAKTEVKQKIVNVLDASSMLEAALRTAVGEELLVNFMRDNSEALGLR